MGDRMQINEPAAERIAGAIVMLAYRHEPLASSASMAAGALLAAINLKLASASAAETAAWLDEVGAALIEQALAGG